VEEFRRAGAQGAKREYKNDRGKATHDEHDTDRFGAGSQYN
jgi:hypothetical protein